MFTYIYIVVTNYNMASGKHNIILDFRVDEPWRAKRLLKVFRPLNTPDINFTDFILRLEDHKGHLLVVVNDCAKVQHGPAIEQILRAAWHSLDEDSANVQIDFASSSDYSFPLYTGHKITQTHNILLGFSLHDHASGQYGPCRPLLPDHLNGKRLLKFFNSIPSIHKYLLSLVDDGDSITIQLHNDTDPLLVPIFTDLSRFAWSYLTSTKSHSPEGTFSNRIRFRYY